MGDRNLSTRIERGVFLFSRVVGLGGILLSLVGGVGGLVVLIFVGGTDTKITLDDVRHAVAMEKGSSDIAVADMYPDVKVPDKVTEYVGGEENLNVLLGWLWAIPEADQQDFLDNMDSLIRESERNGASSSSVINLINKYSSMKTDRITKANIDKTLMYTVKGGAAVFLGLMLLAVLLLNLTLVLLAIERNTRLVAVKES